ncbi:hypothetical protein LRM35_18315 [Klebsiella variicola subsp. variicola]|nr:hypothetical protein LRM35_18315 [Klebsiella variicola subsp. variicola]
MPTLFAIDPGLAPVADFPVGGQHEIEGCPDIVAGETHRQLPGPLASCHSWAGTCQRCSA